MKHQEFTYKDVHFKNIPKEVDVTKEKHLATMEYIYQCHRNNDLQGIFPYTNDGKLIVTWGRGQFEREISKPRDLLRGEILFTDVRYELNNSHKLVLTKQSLKRIEKLEHALEQNREGFSFAFPKIIIDNKEIFKVPCKDVDILKITIQRKNRIAGNLYFSDVLHNGYGKILENERLRLVDIQNRLRKYTLEELEQILVEENKVEHVKVIHVRGKKLMNIPSFVSLSDLEQMEVSGPLKPLSESSGLEVKSAPTEMESIDNNIKHTNVKLAPDISREPIGSMRPRKVDNVQPYTTSRKIIIKEGSLNPVKESREVKVVLRDQTLVQQLKQLYRHTCQVCGEVVETGFNQYSTEVHHIQPLGLHNGPDMKENMIVLCPNHHVMFDRGAITLDLQNERVQHINENNSLHNKKITIKHTIHQKYVDYHNLMILKK
ncbi:MULTISPECIES: HNH endonuclease [Sutcliffiella]|uniref:HNH nuclease domain-containing protein n=1 Tax=Sutcliffiella cohnii TaxID=33932 RepID=A0A223KNI6_9BACI|nr:MULTISPECIES: HNH endonuclease [Sutcliffiella]AST91009.1 hypothetical protein BC6307_06810 [Sutcliffiella cohnii]WBL16804.1 HNH endonuclease [Sutcliffiella sp. NC1]